jgi:hypothetical protein
MALDRVALAAAHEGDASPASSLVVWIVVIVAVVVLFLIARAIFGRIRSKQNRAVPRASPEALSFCPKGSAHAHNGPCAVSICSAALADHLPGTPELDTKSLRLHLNDRLPATRSGRRSGGPETEHIRVGEMI